jgi:hypothetical protein
MGTVDVVFGRVVAIHIADSAIGADGRLDVLKIRPIARLGYYDYTSIESTFEMAMPGAPGSLILAGLEGKLGQKTSSYEA